jgi:DNA-binding transcriptional regulator YiaG
MDSFGTVLQRLRVAYFAKQQCLAAGVGCTEAAVSFWESNRRLPSSQLLVQLITRIKEAGASPKEISELATAYRAAVIERHEKGLSLVY